MWLGCVCARLAFRSEDLITFSHPTAKKAKREPKAAAKEKKAKGEPKVAKEKKAKDPNAKPRTPSAYNNFFKVEMVRLKTATPDQAHKERFAACAANWSALSDDAKAAWKTQCA